MKKAFIILLNFVVLLLGISRLHAQTVSGPSGYKVKDLGIGPGDYTRSLVLLHEIYNGTLLGFNNTVGTITAFRGNEVAGSRMDVAQVNTTSAYNRIFGGVQSVSMEQPWKLKTCVFQGKKYLALEPSYSDAHYNWSFQFAGWANSTGESLLCVNYMFRGQPINQDLISNIEDFTANLIETHDVTQMNITGGLNIGTETVNTDYKLQVKGKVRAQEIKVETANWPDYVFAKDYVLPSLKETEKHIQEKGHLPGIPSAEEVKNNGVNIGEMNAKLLKKIEELTLHLIEQNKMLQAQQTEINSLKIASKSHAN
ncbi:hypothetical protein [Pedobacter nutrimenti]|uniref:Uncharacterized protein n=1 Tax=Pedobacter nutrimenti TaxID=1241337 RepID=A0A318UFJ0_9SPHI|nr:hypothetical protein [Pedobacter nutrimenti]PYF74250.1 hypothetical protein B0O44_104421 [Pedobacter nutrimenti]